MRPTDVEIRVLGSLLEKQLTTPDAYPLSLNSLRLACNQSTNRDPVVEYDEAQIREALTGLARRRWSREVSLHGSRTSKFRHLLPEALNTSPAETAIICVLMLRGPQTPGELKQRTERLHGFDDLATLTRVLSGLIERDYVVRLDRRPGQKEVRYEQLAGGDAGGEDAGGGGASGSYNPCAGDHASQVTEPGRVPEAEPQPQPEPGRQPDPDRFTQLEQEISEMKAEIAELRSRLIPPR